jgi:hypothetical protein
MSDQKLPCLESSLMSVDVNELIKLAKIQA